MTTDINDVAEKSATVPDTSTTQEKVTSTGGAGTKRPASAVSGNTTNNRPIKRRASKACQCCRSRKVRCNVVEHGAPCTNCRLDNVECIITESKRRSHAHDKPVKPKKQSKPAEPGSPSSSTHEDVPDEEHIPVFTYPSCKPLDTIREENGRRKSSLPKPVSQIPFGHLLSQQPSPSNTTSSESHPIRVPSYEILTKDIPSYIRPTPSRLPEDDIDYLVRKGATSIPMEPFRQELIDCYFAYVHPFMPLIEEAEWKKVTSRNWDHFDPSRHKDERISLLLYQAILFAGSAFANMDSLRAAGYSTRKSARKAFFGRTRLLYDFDWEQDRIALIQSLLLMTYWYETPDDQKDTWHWMGVAISLSHTVGLHRNPESSNLSPRRQRLWKKIWWSCFMRDRLVALGMRRPTRIKDEDCDVPMLNLEDFGFTAENDELAEIMLGGDFEDRKKRKQDKILALMCIEKAKLCVIIGQVLHVQYSVVNSISAKDGFIDTTKNLMLLHPKKTEVEACEVKLCDEQLTEWQRKLSPETFWRPANSMLEEADPVILLHRNLLHMVYFTTLSALHRPQVLPSAPAPWPARNRSADLQEISRKKVRHAAHEITRLAEELIEHDLVKFLPTVGVTVMLPAVIIHLLDIKSSSAVTRELSLQGFGLCMQVMQGLRENYAAADFATHFLEAAVKKANIQIPVPQRQRFATADDAMKALHRQRAHAFLVKRGVEIMQDNLFVPRNEGILGSCDMGVAVSVGVETPTGDEMISMNLGADHQVLRERIEAFLADEHAKQSANAKELISPHPMQMNLNQMLLVADGEQPPAIGGGSPESSSAASQERFSGSELSDTAMNNIDALFVNDNDPFLGAHEGITGAGEGVNFQIDWSLVEDGGFDLLGGEVTSGPENADAGKLLDSADFDFDTVMEGLEA